MWRWYGIVKNVWRGRVMALGGPEGAQGAHPAPTSKAALGLGAATVPTRKTNTTRRRRQRIQRPTDAGTD